MRQVKLYTLKEDVVVVTGDYINFHNYQDRLIQVRGSDEFIIDATINIKQVGVERYVEFGRNAQEKEHLVAFEPEIRKLLGINEQKLKDELNKLEQRYEVLSMLNKVNIETKNMLSKENEDLVEKLNAYSFITFWQRLLFLFTGKVGDTK